MMQETLIAATAIACAAMGGVFFAFSSFVMQGLRRLPPAQGMAAMQSINVAAVTPIFMTAAFGTAAACVVVGSRAVIDWRATPSIVLIAGSLSYLIGTIAVTIAFNVPLNNALAALHPAAADAAGVWTRYRQRWIAWNHVRAVSSLAASAWFVYALTMLRI